VIGNSHTSPPSKLAQKTWALRVVYHTNSVLEKSVSVEVGWKRHRFNEASLGWLYHHTVK
jgi:hypothetical protein